MKKQIRSLMKLTPFLLALSMLFGAAACNQGGKQNKEEITKEEVKSEIKDAAGTANAYLTQEQQEVVDAYEERMDKLQVQIDELNDQMESASESARLIYQNRINEFETVYARAESDVEDLKNASQDAWEELNKGLEEAISELEEAFQRTKEEFNEES